MNAARNILMIGVVLVFLAAPAAGDWNYGEPYKMHFPQLPDPNGWDVAFLHEGNPTRLADDWVCSQTGAVDDIHFWCSWEQDLEYEIFAIHVEIYSNVPEGPDGYSIPGERLWERDFLMGEFTIRHDGTGEQGWFQPCAGLVEPNDHQEYYQVNITEIADPLFTQQEGEVYWLCLQAMPFPAGNVGWKTADVDRYPPPNTGEHFMDDAVYMPFDGGRWHELHDPLTGESLDFAFVITPEPGALSLIALGGLALLRRRRR